MFYCSKLHFIICLNFKFHKTILKCLLQLLDPPLERTLLGNRKYHEDFPGQGKGQTKCMFCKTIFHGGIYRLKYHIAGVHGHDAKPCLKAVPEDVRECYVMVEEIESKKKQKEDRAAIGRETVL